MVVPLGVSHSKIVIGDSMLETMPTETNTSSSTSTVMRLTHSHTLVSQWRMEDTSIALRLVVTMT